MADDLQAQLSEVAGEGAALAGKLATIAGAAATPPPPPAPARAPTTRAPRLPKAPALPLEVGEALGEQLAAALAVELGRVFPEDVLTVRYVPPAILVDYLPLRLKLTIRHQHAIGGLGTGPDEVMVEQSSGPRGMFRAKTGTPREVVDGIVRFFKRLRAAPPPAAPAGKRKHAKPCRAKPTRRPRPVRKRQATRRMLARDFGLGKLKPHEIALLAKFGVY